MNRNKYTKNKSNLISIVTPVFNRLEWLPMTLNSLREQTYKNFEVLIVNDGGENPKNILNQYPDLNIKYLEHSNNSGLSAARNTAMKNASGDYFVLLDSDDSLMPLALEFRLSMLKKYNEEIVYTRVLKDIYERRKVSETQDSYVLIAQTLYWSCHFNRDLILSMNISPCNGILFSRRSWENTGNWFDTELHTGEDFSFWQGLSRKYNFKELLLCDANCSYRTDGNQMSGVLDFSKDLPRIFKKYRHTAQNLEWVTNSQNQILLSRGINPSDYGL